MKLAESGALIKVTTYCILVVFYHICSRQHFFAKEAIFVRLQNQMPFKFEIFFFPQFLKKLWSHSQTLWINQLNLSYLQHIWVSLGSKMLQKEICTAFDLESHNQNGFFGKERLSATNMIKNYQNTGRWCLFTSMHSKKMLFSKFVTNLRTLWAFKFVAKCLADKIDLYQTISVDTSCQSTQTYLK